MYGGGANVCAGAADTAGAGGAGDLLLGMNGRGARAGGAGFCGRPTSAVAHVPTQRSDPRCANMSGSPRTSTNANTIAAAAATLMWWTRWLVSSLLARTSLRWRKTGRVGAILLRAPASWHGMPAESSDHDALTSAPPTSTTPARRS